MTRAGDSPPLPPRRRHPLRDFIELALSVLVLYLVIRQFGCEIFKIPTGSMAPTLLGQHRDMHCPNCGLEFPADGALDNSGQPEVKDVVCPNCGYAFPEAEVADTYCTCFPAWPQALFKRGDYRVIVDKFMWDFSADAISRAFYRLPFRRVFLPPKRWDVIVFRVPMATVAGPHNENEYIRVDEAELNDAQGGSPGIESERRAYIERLEAQRQTYIKRLVGLPGETIEIRHGDIYVNGKIARRPPEVQDAVWQFVYDSAHVPREQLLPEPAWIGVKGEVQREGSILRLIPAKDGVAEALYGRAVLDNSIYSGRAGEYPVGELRCETEVKLDGPGILRLKIQCDDLTCAASVRFGAGAEKTGIRTSLPRGAPVENDFAADPAKPHRVVFYNSSGLFQLSVDGADILSLEPPMASPMQTTSSSFALEAASARAEFSRIRLDRNVYYLPAEDLAGFAMDVTGRQLCFPETTKFVVPAREYFVLGDNVRSSLDSRFWGAVPAHNLLGRAVVIWWPPGRLRPIP